MTGSSPEDNEFDESDDAAWQAIVDELGPLTLPPADSKSTQTSPETDESASDIPARASSSWRGPDDPQRSLAEIFNDDHLGLEQDDDESLEDGFTPPDPGPILDGDPLLTMAWFGAVGGPLILFILALFWRSAPSWLFWSAGVMALAGLSVLIWRMPHSRESDDFDDGARV